MSNMILHRDKLIKNKNPDSGDSLIFKLFYLLIMLLDDEELEECIEVYKGINPE